ncbi:hypothetical protein NIES970_11580 [[Synechococcus] sp. NIES-970]|nr:hypothetical protein NIES970_11580 [[Synechococcus] sp. NIES-970]
MQREKQVNCIDRYGTKNHFLWRGLHCMGSLKPLQIRFFEFVRFGNDRLVFVCINADKIMAISLYFFVFVTVKSASFVMKI